MNVAQGGRLEDMELDATMPPQRSLRFEDPKEMYEAIPELGSFIKTQPLSGESTVAFYERLVSSPTPEDAVTLLSFVTDIHSAVSWGLQVARMGTPDLSEDDTSMSNHVTRWLAYPNDDNRWRAMQAALFAPERSAMVYLGLAVGWSGGPLAPNDPSEPPLWRCPRAVNAAVMTVIAGSAGERRKDHLFKVLDLANGLFRLYSR